MGKGRDVIEFPDSTINANVMFSEKDMKLLDETDTTDTSQSHISAVPALNGKFTATIVVLLSGGLLQIILYCFVHLCPQFIGSFSMIIAMFSYEWQRMYASCLTRTPRASFNYGDLLKKNKDYIPFFTMGWLLGERYKPFIIGCTPEQQDDRTPNEPEAVSPERAVPTDPKFYR